MGRITVIDGAVRRTVDTLGPRRAGHVRQAIAWFLAVDELSGEPVRDRIRVTSTLPMLTGRAGSGVAGLVGVPAQAFPRLDVQPYDVDITVEVDGFTPWSTTRTLTSQGGFPGTFARLDLGPVPLRRRPVSVSVMTYDLGPQNRPRTVSGADVRISRVWRRVDQLGQPGVASPMLSLPLGVSQHWPGGTALDSIGLVPAAEPARRLVSGVAPGDARLGVDRAGALTATDLVGLDLADAERREYLTVAGVAGPLDPNSPADVDVTGPVRSVHVDATTARRVPAPPAAPPDAHLTEVAEPGDTTVFVDTTAPFGGVEILRARAATIDDEYVVSRLYRVTSNGDGLALLPPLSRVAAVEITATSGALSATARLTPAYTTTTNVLTMTLT